MLHVARREASVAAETSQTLDRGLRVLAMLADAPEGLTVPEIAAAVEVNRTVVYRVLATLEQHGLVRRDPVTNRCRLGMGALQFARRAEPLVRDAALPCLRSLADDTGATSHLTVMDGENVLVLAVAEPAWTDYHVSYRVGARHPLGREAAGLAILDARRAYADDRLPQPWVATPGDGVRAAPGVAAAVPRLAGFEAAVGVIGFGELEPARLGPRVARAAGEVHESLAGTGGAGPADEAAEAVGGLLPGARGGALI